MYTVFKRILLICIICVILNVLSYKSTISDGCNYDIKKHGFTVINGLFNQTDIDNVNKMVNSNADLREIRTYVVNRVEYKLQEILENSNYVFQDYLLEISNAEVHTCHRDFNGDFSNKGQQYPSYTLVIYLEPMLNGCMNVEVGSHKKLKLFHLTNKTQSIMCSPGDALLFDANLIHAGVIGNPGTGRRLQMKLTHKIDISTINYYENYYKRINKPNVFPDVIKHLQQHVSCQQSIMSDSSQHLSIQQAKGEGKGTASLLQKLYSLCFYGDWKYYDLKNT